MVTLQAYPRRLDALEQMLTQEKNRLKITPEELKADIEGHIEYLKEQAETIKKRWLDHVQAHDSLQEQHRLLTSTSGSAMLRPPVCWLKLAPSNTLIPLGNLLPLRG